MKNWTKTKPKFKNDCILIVAIFFDHNSKEYWEYTLYTVEWLDFGEGPYWALICDDGEEWGDIEDLKADKYLVMPMLKKPKRGLN